jgi:hypothetical protein
MRKATEMELIQAKIKARQEYDHDPHTSQK